MMARVPWPDHNLTYRGQVEYNENQVELSTRAPCIPCGVRAQRNDLQRISMHNAMAIPGMANEGSLS